MNKQFDENGNLTSYDSTYTYSYSTMNGDTIAPGEMNTMMENFRQQFESRRLNSNPGFSFFFNDASNFSNEDFSGNSFPEDMQKQMEQMDSSQNQLFNQHSQPLINREEENKSLKKMGNKI